MLKEEVYYLAGRGAYTSDRGYYDYPRDLTPTEIELWQYGYDMASSEDVSLGDYNK